MIDSKRITAKSLDDTAVEAIVSTYPDHRKATASSPAPAMEARMRILSRDLTFANVSALNCGTLYAVSTAIIACYAILRNLEVKASWKDGRQRSK